MLASIMTVASFSFQISGAIILLLWSLGKCDEKIKRMSVEKDGPIWKRLDESADVSKEDLQKNAKTVYQNIAAFANILIGYTCAIFAETPGLSAWGVFGFVVITTAAILLAEYVLTNRIVKKKYPCDQKVKV